MSKSSVRKRGFTLIELLVVITIIAILIALLLPAVQQAREAARRTQCKNNLKQIALAAHNYHDAFSQFPPAMINFNGSNLASWCVFLLPFMDERPLYEMFIDAGYFDTAVPAVNPNPPGSIPEPNEWALDLLRCPSETTQVTAGITNYLGNWGAGQPGTPAPLSAGLGGQGAGAVRDITTDSNIDGGGIFVTNGRIRLRDVKDGTGNTALFGECVGSLPNNADGEDTVTQFLWGGVGVLQHCADSHDPDALGGTSTGGSLNKGSQLDAKAGTFGSNHEAGAQFALCDGTVKFINESIDYNQTGVNSTQGTYQNFLDRRDGRVVADAFEGAGG